MLLAAPQFTSAARYEVDPSHSHIGFSIKHLVISNVKGNFKEFSGTIEVDEKDNIKKTFIEIEMASIDTNHKKRDKHLRDFGIVWNKLLETGGLLVGEKIKISLELEVILKK